MGIMKKKLKEEIIIMEKKKSYGVLIAGAILLILGIVLALAGGVITYIMGEH